MNIKGRKNNVFFIRFYKKSLKCLLHTTALICTCLLVTAHAAIVTETLPNGHTVTAEYKAGNPNKPAIIVLHGFLQTYSFLATHNIIEGIASLEHPILAPNLSLGVPNRKKSLQCDAVHQHTLANDLEEIDFWRNWLKLKGIRDIIFVGHSWGSQHALAYLNKSNTQANVLGVIAISLISAHINKPNAEFQLQKLKLSDDGDTNKLYQFELSFCQNYTSTVKSFLSYAEWNEIKLISAIDYVSNAKIPLFAILGSADKRLKGREALLAELEQKGVKISIVEGANHFFSADHEFDLIDELEDVLEQLNPRLTP